ncbi:MAG: hypothetical protein SFT68_00210 [Rickettsiaceae bacterium]|nr:hypothetical protein [Rickettsiaceae bacterium]
MSRNTEILPSGEKRRAGIIKQIQDNQTQDISFPCQDFSQEHQKLLVAALKANNSLEKLHIKTYSIDLNFAKAIAGALEKNTHIKILDLHIWRSDATENLRTSIIEILTCLKANQTIVRLDLCLQDLEPKAIRGLYNALEKNTSLKTLIFRHMQIKDEESAHLLGQILQKKSNITSLYIESCQISKSNLSIIVDSLKENTGIKKLSFFSDQLTADQAILIANLLKVNSTLCTLILSKNYIGDEGASAIADALKVNNTIQKLDLSDNSIKDDGISAISNALKFNISLNHLALDNNTIGKPPTLSIIGVSLSENNSLVSLKLALNSGKRIQNYSNFTNILNNTIITDIELGKVCTEDILSLSRLINSNKVFRQQTYEQYSRKDLLNSEKFKVLRANAQQFMHHQSRQDIIKLLYRLEIESKTSEDESICHNISSPVLVKSKVVLPNSIVCKILSFLTGKSFYNFNNSDFPFWSNIVGLFIQARTPKQDTDITQAASALTCLKHSAVGIDFEEDPRKESTKIHADHCDCTDEEIFLLKPKQVKRVSRDISDEEYLCKKPRLEDSTSSERQDSEAMDIEATSDNDNFRVEITGGEELISSFNAPL